MYYQHLSCNIWWVENRFDNLCYFFWGWLGRIDDRQMHFGLVQLRLPARRNQTFCTWKVFYELHHARATRGLEGPSWKERESDGVDGTISWFWCLQVWCRTDLITHDIRIKRYYIWVNYIDLTWTPARDSLVTSRWNFAYFRVFQITVACTLCACVFLCIFFKWTFFRSKIVV